MSDCREVRSREPKLRQLIVELIEQARALSLVFRLARELQDAWVNCPALSAALMVAELGVKAAAIQEALEKHARAHLDELAEILRNWRQQHASHGGPERL